VYSIYYCFEYPEYTTQTKIEWVIKSNSFTSYPFQNRHRQMTTNQPPILPVPRYPSPLSLGMDTLGVDLVNGHREGIRRSIYSNASSPVPSVFESDELESSSNTRPASSIQYPAGPSFKVPLLPSRERIPIRPSPDSIVHRTTLKQLESQTVTLKRLTKTVLANLAVVSGIYEQLDRAEDELLGSLGELSTWMGHGYGLKDGIWDADAGVRGVKREKRKREKEDLEVMVAQGVDNVRSELKRRGLAGGGATARYEVSQKSRTLQWANGRNRNKGTTPKQEPTSLLDQAQWPHLNPPLISRAHRTSAPLTLPPPTVPSSQRQPKWISCRTNTIPPFYTPSHRVHSSASTYWLASIHGPVRCYPTRSSAAFLLQTTHPVRKDSTHLSDSFLDPTSPLLHSKRL